MLQLETDATQAGKWLLDIAPVQTGDTAVAQQLLGNADLKSTLVYAKRAAGALTAVAGQGWEKHKAEGGRNWSQKQSVEEKNNDFK